MSRLPHRAGPTVKFSASKQGRGGDGDVRLTSEVPEAGAGQRPDGCGHRRAGYPD